MPGPEYIIRNYRPSDFDGFLQLKNQYERLTRWTPQSLRDSLRRPNYSPERDLFLVEHSGEIVGYLDITLSLIHI